MNCKICNSTTTKIFAAAVIQKHKVDYFQCNSCQFTFTENPYWLEEAYSDAISDLDVGYATRNIYLSEITDWVIKFCFQSQKKFVDYGGGYGLFVRLMRDRGYDFLRQDLYCKNIFSNHFNYSEDSTDTYEMLTAYEVFEHLPNPLEEITKMLAVSPSILFSTEILPNISLKDVKSWWYFMPETGQHVSFYSIKSLKYIARQNKMNLYSNGKNLHLISPKKFLINPIWAVSTTFKIFNFIFSRHFFLKKSLINKDFEGIKMGKVILQS